MAQALVNRYPPNKIYHHLGMRDAAGRTGRGGQQVNQSHSLLMFMYLKIRGLQRAAARRQAGIPIKHLTRVITFGGSPSARIRGRPISDNNFKTIYI